MEKILSIKKSFSWKNIILSFFVAGLSINNALQAGDSISKYVAILAVFLVIPLIYHERNSRYVLYPDRLELSFWPLLLFQKFDFDSVTLHDHQLTLFRRGEVVKQINISPNNDQKEIVQYLKDHHLNKDPDK